MEIIENWLRGFCRVYSRAVNEGAVSAVGARCRIHMYLLTMELHPGEKFSIRCAAGRGPGDRYPDHQR